MQKSDAPLTVDKTETAKVSSTGISTAPPQNVVNNGGTGGTAGNKGKRGNKNGGRNQGNQGGRGGKHGQNGKGFQRANNNTINNTSQGERPKWEENSHKNGSSKILEVNN